MMNKRALKRVLVIGDVIIDEYTYGTPLGISAETPTMVARQDRVETYVGGAGLVVRHLLRLGCHVSLATVQGFTEDISKLMLTSSDSLKCDEFSRFFVDTIVVDPDWCFTRKRRFFMGDYKVAQFDILNCGRWDKQLREIFFASIVNKISDFDAIVICDNRHGTMDEALARCIIELKDRPTVYIDSQVSQNSSNHSWYAEAEFMFMNRREARSVLLGEYPGSVSDEDTVKNLNDRFKTSVVLKRGAEGSLAFIDDRWRRNVPDRVDVVDTCGAGDAFLAAFVAHDDCSISKRLQTANDWAARSTTYRGTVVPEVIS